MVIPSPPTHWPSSPSTSLPQCHPKQRSPNTQHPGWPSPSFPAVKFHYPKLKIHQHFPHTTFPNKSPWQLMLLAQNWARMHPWGESLNCCLGLGESLSCSAWGCFTLIENNKALFCLLEEKQGSKCHSDAASAALHWPQHVYLDYTSIGASISTDSSLHHRK